MKYCARCENFVLPECFELHQQNHILRDLYVYGEATIDDEMGVLPPRTLAYEVTA